MPLAKPSSFGAANRTPRAVHGFFVFPFLSFVFPYPLLVVHSQLNPGDRCDVNRKMHLNGEFIAISS